MPYLRVKNELPLIPGYASGDIASFEAAAAPLVSCICTINPVQSGSGDPSPSNVRPITGHDDVTVTQSGKNLFDKTKGIEEKYLNGNGYEINSGSYNVTDYIEVKGGANITISGESTGGSAPCICYYDKNKTLLSAESHSGFSIPHTYTVPSNAYYFRESYEGASKDTFQIEYGNSASAYSSYVTGTTTTTDLGTTVYGATLDVETGGTTLSDKQQKRVLDGTEAWFVSATSSDTTVFALGSAMSVPDQNDQICSHFKYNSNAYLADSVRANTFVQGASSRLFIQVPNTLASTVEDFKAWLAQQSTNGTPVTYIANKTPITTQLTPEPLNSILGDNNFYHDGNGPIDITYIRRY